jgi:polar amino acid transport system substrate-binding protein
MNNKKFLVIAILLISGLVLSACGNAQSTAAPAEAESAEAPTAVAPTEAAPTEATSELTYDENGIPQYDCLGTAEDALVDLNCQEVTVAVENAYLPFNYIDSNTHKAGGWDYTVVPELCKRLHCKPVFQECSWDVMIQSVADGLYDMAGDGITITEEREKIVDFSEGYINIDQRLLVNKGETRFASMEDFVANPELILGTQVSTTNYETAIKYLPEDRVNAFEQFPIAIQALLSHDVDAVLIDEVAGLGYVGENRDKLEFVGSSLSSDSLGFAFNKGSNLVGPFNQAIQSMKDDGSLNELNLQFFGPSFSVTESDIE